MFSATSLLLARNGFTQWAWRLGQEFLLFKPEDNSLVVKSEVEGASVEVKVSELKLVMACNLVERTKENSKQLRVSVDQAEAILKGLRTVLGDVKEESLPTTSILASQRTIWRTFFTLATVTATKESWQMVIKMIPQRTPENGLEDCVECIEKTVSDMCLCGQSELVHELLRAFPDEIPRILAACLRCYEIEFADFGYYDVNPYIGVWLLHRSILKGLKRSEPGDSIEAVPEFDCGEVSSEESVAERIPPSTAAIETFVDAIRKSLFGSSTFRDKIKAGPLSNKQLRQNFDRLLSTLAWMVGKYLPTYSEIRSKLIAYMLDFALICNSHPGNDGISEPTFGKIADTFLSSDHSNAIFEHVFQLVTKNLTVEDLRLRRLATSLLDVFRTVKPPESDRPDRSFSNAITYGIQLSHKLFNIVKPARDARLADITKILDDELNRVALAVVEGFLVFSAQHSTVVHKPNCLGFIRELCILKLRRWEQIPDVMECAKHAVRASFSSHKGGIHRDFQSHPGMNDHDMGYQLKYFPVFSATTSTSDEQSWADGSRFNYMILEAMALCSMWTPEGMLGLELLLHDILSRTHFYELHYRSQGSGAWTPPEGYCVLIMKVIAGIKHRSEPLKEIFPMFLNMLVTTEFISIDTYWLVKFAASWSRLSLAYGGYVDPEKVPWPDEESENRGHPDDGLPPLRDPEYATVVLTLFDRFLDLKDPLGSRLIQFWATYFVFIINDYLGFGSNADVHVVSMLPEFKHCDEPEELFGPKPEDFLEIFEELITLSYEWEMEGRYERASQVVFIALLLFDHRGSSNQVCSFAEVYVGANPSQSGAKEGGLTPRKGVTPRSSTPVRSTTPIRSTPPLTTGITPTKKDQPPVTPVRYEEEDAEKLERFLRKALTFRIASLQLRSPNSPQIEQWMKKKSKRLSYEHTLEAIKTYDDLDSRFWGLGMLEESEAKMFFHRRKRRGSDLDLLMDRPPKVVKVVEDVCEVLWRSFKSMEYNERKEGSTSSRQETIIALHSANVGWLYSSVTPFVHSQAFSLHSLKVITNALSSSHDLSPLQFARYSLLACRLYDAVIGGFRKAGLSKWSSFWLTPALKFATTSTAMIPWSVHFQDLEKKLKGESDSNETSPVELPEYDFSKIESLELLRIIDGLKRRLERDFHWQWKKIEPCGELEKLHRGIPKFTLGFDKLVDPNLLPQFRDDLPDECYNMNRLLTTLNVAYYSGDFSLGWQAGQHLTDYVSAIFDALDERKDLQAVTVNHYQFKNFDCGRWRVELMTVLGVLCATSRSTFLLNEVRKMEKRIDQRLDQRRKIPQGGIYVPGSERELLFRSFFPDRSDSFLSQDSDFDEIQETYFPSLAITLGRDESVSETGARIVTQKTDNTFDCLFLHSVKSKEKRVLYLTLTNSRVGSVDQEWQKSDLSVEPVCTARIDSTGGIDAALSAFNTVLEKNRRSVKDAVATGRDKMGATPLPTPRRGGNVSPVRAPPISPRAKPSPRDLSPIRTPRRNLADLGISPMPTPRNGVSPAPTSKKDFWNKRRELDAELGRCINDFESQLTSNPNRAVTVLLKHLEESTRPLVLFIDGKSGLANLPFEHMKFLQHRQITRGVATNTLLDTIQSSCKRKVITIKYRFDTTITSTHVAHYELPPSKKRPDSGFYLVNPNGDAQVNAHGILSSLQSLDWSGHIGVVPSKDQVSQQLSEKEGFLYSGHHGGQQYIDCEKVEKGAYLEDYREDKFPVFPKKKLLATSLLMGCSSAKQHSFGEKNDTFSLPNHYLIGGSPAVVGTLWDVLSGDIDKVTVSMLEEWGGKGDDQGDLDRAIQIARTKCRLPNLTGCSIVKYGIPFVPS